MFVALLPYQVVTPNRRHSVQDAAATYYPASTAFSERMQFLNQQILSLQISTRCLEV